MLYFFAAFFVGEQFLRHAVCVFVNHTVGRRHNNSRASVILLQSDGRTMAALEMPLEVLKIANTGSLH